MADHILERRLWLPHARPHVFAFFADGRNLHRALPPSLGFRWLRPPPEQLAAGVVVDFRVRTFGVPARCRAFIREFDPPYRFVAVEIWGPFARWEHRHRFLEGPREERGRGPVGTWIEDRVTYRLPMGALGRLVHAIAVKRRVDHLFDVRDRQLGELLGAPDGEARLGPVGSTSL
jgi:hypothetical protein